MRKVILSLSLLICCQLIFAHGGHLATYNYVLTSHTITLEVEVETAVLDHYELEAVCPNFQRTTALCLADYITTNSSFLLDGETICFELERAEKNAHSYSLTLVAKGNFSASSRLEIDNYCFYEFDASFKNRIILNRPGNIKSYLLGYKNTSLAL